MSSIAARLGGGTKRVRGGGARPWSARTGRAPERKDGAMTVTDSSTATAGTTTTVVGSIGFANWEERETAGSEAGPRLARASVVNTFTGGIEAADTTCDYSIAYTVGHEGSFTGIELVTGSVDGRAGTFVLEERGTFAA